MKDERKEKIRDLKCQIKTQQENLIQLVKAVNVEEQLTLTEEERAKAAQEFKNTVEVEKVKIDNLKEALKQTRDNKYSSSFFEFIPTPPGRRMRRLALKHKLKPA